VGVDQRGDDGLTEPDALAVADSFVEAGERLEQRRHRRLRHEWPAVGDGDVRSVVVGARHDSYRTSGEVVVDGVVDQVGDEVLEQDPVAEGGAG
jgi:hypothetical protein